MFVGDTFRDIGSVKKKHNSAFWTIISSHFFKENKRTVTVISKRYVRMTEKCNYLNSKKLKWVICGSIRMETQTTRIFMNLLREHIPERIISLRGDLQWPAHSPDLAPYDCFLWDYLKTLVDTNRLKTLNQLKDKIFVLLLST